MRSLDVAVLGASGFVGSAVVSALQSAGHRPRLVAAPRLLLRAEGAQLASAADVCAREASDMAASFLGADAVVVCAGVSDATAPWTPELGGANSLLPLLALRAADSAGVSRLVHVSTAAVQGRRALDSSMQLDPSSPYARSKARAELALVGHVARPDLELVIYRPPGVHGPRRAVTRSVQALARSPWSVVAADGPAPQATIGDVARAVTYLATCDTAPPTIVHHPWSGITTVGLLEHLGRRTPRRVPRWAVHVLLRIAYWAGRFHPLPSAYARRIEILMLGQVTGESWLDDRSWGGEGVVAWEALGRALSSEREMG